MSLVAAEHVAKRAAAVARKAALLAAGAVVLTGNPRFLAIGEVNIPKHGRAALSAILAHQNDEEGRAFPSFERLADYSGCTRRTAVTRVNVLRELTFEEHGVEVVVEPRWHSSQRGADESVRSNVYWTLWRPEIAAKVGVKLHDPASGPLDDEMEADGFAAPFEPYEGTPGVPVGAAAGSRPSDPPPPREGPVRAPEAARPASVPSRPAVPCKAPPAACEEPDTPEVKACREKMLAHPETAALAPDAAKWWGIALNPGKNRKTGQLMPPRTLPQALQAIEDMAQKSLSTEAAGVVWSRGVAFLKVADPVKEERPRIAPEKLRDMKLAEERDRAARAAEAVQEARKLAERLGIEASSKAAPGGAKDFDKAAAARRFLRGYDPDDKPP